MTDDADAAARVIERLLVDPAFRASFRRDPASACSEAGLDEMAQYMAQGSGKAMHTLEIRESKSSLAGVMMAAALEGIGVFEFAKHIVPGAAAVPGAARDVLSRVNLPAIDGLRGSLAQPPDAPAGGAGEDAATDTGAPAATNTGAPAATNASSSMAAVPAPAPAQAQAPAPAAAPEAKPEAGAAADRPAAGADKPAAEADEPAGSPAADKPAENIRYARAAAVQSAPPSAPAAQASAAPAAPAVEAQASAAPAAPAVEPQASGAPVDPAQFGAEGTGGDPSPEMLAILENKNVHFDNFGVTDIKAGRIDPRVVAVLAKLSEDHEITVSCMCSDHPTFTTGGSVSNHHHGRGVDIAAIDGVPVNAGNPMARDVATALSELDPTIRPNEIGTPWAINGPGYFTDADHNDHLHVGFKQAIDPSWKPPADQAAAAAAVPVTAAPGAPVAAGAGGTLSIAVPQRAGAAKAGAGTMSLKIAAAGAAPAAGAVSGAAPAGGVAAPAAGVATAPADGAGAVAENAVPGASGESDAGAKAVAALKEALKYKGTDYLWGGSNPDTGFDCSGLVQWAYARQGIEIPRVTDQQILAKNGSEVARKDLVPGDLVFFRDPSGYVYHVGISMGGDRFLHAPKTGDVVKESSLSEPYFAERFTGGRRFDDTPGGAPEATPAPAAVQSASAAVARDAAAVRSPNSMIFKALTKQEAIHHSSTVQFIRAIKPEEAAQAKSASVAAAAQQADPAAVTGPTDYPGNDAGKEKLAQWLAVQAQKAGLPPELPVMAALVESGVANLAGGDADSAGFFQMRVGIWDRGAYAGYREKPELQAKWFIDTALAHQKKMIAAGNTNFGKDPSSWGNWIADVERPAAQYRGRYQLRLDEARGLLGRKS